MLLAASASLVESIAFEDARVANAIEDARMQAIEDAAEQDAEEGMDSARGNASASASNSANNSAVAIANAIARASASRVVFASQPLELDARDADGTTALMAAAKTNLRQAPALVALLIGTHAGGGCQSLNYSDRWNKNQQKQEYGKP
jgi:hypothetical protein